ncbi:Uncharacterised protein [Mycobacterium tuberculosis]|uniref:Uncharacterized protein n=1 Tax=Mycobacterium tuberculosis TaxID=1773 RepID=A0A916LCP9_MYCTX|nr:Uncharacterised protein [Mycobacterium tuberculosis]COY82246.1 Uncharacterised protein [Mycobacterium tuberculosis]
MAFRRCHLFHDAGDLGAPVLGDLTDDISSTLGQRRQQLPSRGGVR